jgi:hypothetical protein
MTVKVKQINNNNQTIVSSFSTSDDEELPEKIYDWDAIISDGPQFKYNDSFGKFSSHSTRS